MGCFSYNEKRIGGITAMAWLSCTGKEFSCEHCKRKNFACAKTHCLTPDEIDEKLQQGKFPKSMPLIYRAESVGICPKLLISDFSQTVSKAHAWWEKNQLGVNFLEAPAWVDEAFTVYNNSKSEAINYMQKRSK